MPMTPRYHLIKWMWWDKSTLVPCSVVFFRQEISGQQLNGRFSIGDDGLHFGFQRLIEFRGPVEKILAGDHWNMVVRWQAGSWRVYRVRGSAGRLLGVSHQVNAEESN